MLGAIRYFNEKYLIKIYYKCIQKCNINILNYLGLKKFSDLVIAFLTSIILKRLVKIFIAGR